jgi:hypothetical protein
MKILKIAVEVREDTPGDTWYHVAVKSRKRTRLLQSVLVTAGQLPDHDRRRTDSQHRPQDLRPGRS